MARVLITGPPGSGKTTLVQAVVEELRGRAEPLAGFVTGEIRRGGRRTGFVVTGIGGLERTLAVRGGPGPRVGSYGVDVDAFEEVALLELDNGLELGQTLVIDEIGKMELLSAAFRELVVRSFSQPRVLATARVDADPLTEELAQRGDVHTVAMPAARSPETVAYIADLVTDVRAAAGT